MGNRNKQPSTNDNSIKEPKKQVDKTVKISIDSESERNKADEDTQQTPTDYAADLDVTREQSLKPTVS